jgi:hypothetical protein
MLMFAVVFSVVLIALIIVARCTSCKHARANLMTGRPVDPFGRYRIR